MVWATLALLGIPLWLCALGILIMLIQNRKLRKRHGDIPVHVRRPGKKHWHRGHAVWVSDVFAWRGSPAAWDEDLFHVSELAPRQAAPEELKKLHRISDDPVVATLTDVEGEQLDVAVTQELRGALLGPFARSAHDQTHRSAPGADIGVGSAE